MARPSKYETHVAPRLSEVADWVRNGASDREVAERLGISADSLVEYKKRFSEFSECLKKTRACVDGQVENALLQKALSGDTTAMIFWLKNRRPEKWREKPKDSENAEDDAVHITFEVKDLTGGVSNED